jgi:hypothetical protein
VDADYGCGVITSRDILHNEICGSYFAYFDDNRRSLLQLISVDKFKEII